MLKLSILPFLAMLISWSPALAAQEEFAPCVDSGSHPGLAGSLCAITRLPLNAVSGDGPEGDDISVFVRKFPAEPHRRRGEIWLVAGGPGESGASFYPVIDVLRRAFADYDLVIPDHRGTGHSSKLCPVEEAPSSPDGIALAGQEWGPCIGALHGPAARTASFTITNAAHDLSALIARYRQTGEVYLYGVSYGTQLVLRTMQVAPIAIDGIILDGLVPPEADLRWDLSRRTQVVDSVGRALLTSEQEAAYRALLAQGEPRWLGAVPGGDLRLFMGSLLNFPDLRDRIPDILAALSNNDTGLLVATAVDLDRRLSELNAYPQSPPSLPLVILISGSENNHRRDLTAGIVESEASEALFTSAIPGLLIDPPIPLYDRDGHFGLSPGDLPRTLIIHGTLDPNTPYEGAKEHAAMLAAAGGDIRFTTVVGAAHFLPLVAPECFERTVSVFIANQHTPEVCKALEISGEISR